MLIIHVSNGIQDTVAYISRTLLSIWWNWSCFKNVEIFYSLEMCHLLMHFYSETKASFLAACIICRTQYVVFRVEKVRARLICSVFVWVFCGEMRSYAGNLEGLLFCTGSGKGPFCEICYWRSDYPQGFSLTLWQDMEISFGGMSSKSCLVNLDLSRVHK